MAKKSDSKNLSCKPEGVPTDKMAVRFQGRFIMVRTTCEVDTPNVGGAPQLAAVTAPRLAPP
ncbi:hypothetical protein WM40_20030 [Robbsia andropogonis]|uniref:Uncharacterized protein n=1 Tax=Robbsia andropogonis TaxID=28092 RepID=A0A0F5JVS9_9BURK|nr:hypothetical protein [Robbsia andropogonis]KKB61971.1 hypothetical protein WM40_20030 [Robbsia andropogonis]MCP1121579.1 hypothetical protein [Robbsia andropogonis]MCP1131395.1 hypothetical protein [Robbsia andropogonis]